MKMFVNSLSFTMCLCLLAIPSAGQTPSTSSDADEQSKQMGISLGKYIVDGAEEEGAKCDQLIDTLLARQDLNAKNLEAVARGARLRKQPSKAIIAIERAIAEHPDAEFAYLGMPGRVVSEIWIASISRQNGDLPRARAAYEQAMQDTYTRAEGEDNKCFRVLVCLLQADCFMASGDPGQAKQTLRAMPTVRIPFSAAEWAEYDLSVLENGSEKARQTLRQTPLQLASVPMARALLVASGICILTPMSLSYGDVNHDSRVLRYSLALAAESKQGGIESELARFCLGADHLEKGDDLAKAKGYFEAVAKGDSFLAPEAGLKLMQCVKKQAKEKEEKSAASDTADIATLVHELKNRFPAYAPAIDKADKELASVPAEYDSKLPGKDLSPRPSK